MMCQTTLNDVYTNWEGTTGAGGFFYYLNYYAEENQIEIPFLTHVESLDLVYHGNFSGSKLVSPLVERWADEEFFPSYAVKLAEMFWKIEGERLLRLWNTYTIEYTPNWNYDMQTSGSEEHDGTDTRSIAGKQTDTTSGKTQTTSKIQGLDSSDFQNSERSETVYGADGQPYKTEREYEDYADTMTYDTTTTRSQTKQGNIGVKTNQEMLREEIQLWAWNFYYQVLFPAVDKLLTLPVY